MDSEQAAKIRLEKIEEVRRAISWQAVVLRDYARYLEENGRKVDGAVLREKARLIDKFTDTELYGRSK